MEKTATEKVAELTRHGAGRQIQWSLRTRHARTHGSLSSLSREGGHAAPEGADSLSVLSCWHPRERGGKARVTCRSVCTMTYPPNEELIVRQGYGRNVSGVGSLYRYTRPSIRAGDLLTLPYISGTRGGGGIGAYRDGAPRCVGTTWVTLTPEVSS